MAQRAAEIFKQSLRASAHELRDLLSSCSLSFSRVEHHIFFTRAFVIVIIIPRYIELVDFRNKERERFMYARCFFRRVLTGALFSEEPVAPAVYHRRRK